MCVCVCVCVCVYVFVCETNILRYVTNVFYFLSHTCQFSQTN